MKTLDDLIEHLKDEPTIKAYRQLEKIIDENAYLKKAYEEVLDKQKRMVQAQHANAKDMKTHEKNYESALEKLSKTVHVEEYLTLQSEVNDLTRMMFDMIEQTLNARLKRD